MTRTEREDQPASLVTFLFNGDSVAAADGDTVASALVAAGKVACRTSSRGSRRGPFCLMGLCQECLVSIDGVPNVRGCITTVRDGMQVVASDDRPSDGPRDLSGSSDRFSIDTPSEAHSEHELIIVGSGPAGLAAALTAASHGVDTVLLESSGVLGGQYYKQPTRSAQHARGSDHVAIQGARLIEQVLEADVRVDTGAEVWGYEPPNTLIATTKAGPKRYVGRFIVVAAGAYDAPMPVPGWTLPGVFTAGGVQTLIRRYGRLPGRATVIAGNGPLNLQVASEVLRCGGRVAAYVEAAAMRPREILPEVATIISQASIVRQAIVFGWRLLAAGVLPIRSHVVSRIDGDGHVEAVTIVRVDSSGTPIEGTSKQVAADSVSLGVGFNPVSSLPQIMGVTHEYDPTIEGHVAVTDDTQRTNLENVFVVGDGARVLGAVAAVEQGRIAADAVAAALGRASAHTNGVARSRVDRQVKVLAAVQRVFSAPSMGSAMLTDDTVICRCEDVSYADLAGAIAVTDGSVAAVKARTHIAMGRCQGRYCGTVLRGLLREKTRYDHALLTKNHAAMPVQPQRIWVIAQEQPEWVTMQAPDPPGIKAPVTLGAQPRAERLAPTDVLIVGGGIVGSALALYLRKLGVETTVLDSGRCGGESSGSNAGSLHLQMQFHIAKRSDERIEAFLPGLALGRHAIAVWRTIDAWLDGATGLTPKGGVMVAESSEEAALLRRKIAIEREQGIAAEYVDGREVMEGFPYLSDRVCAVAYCADEGKVNPLTATPAMTAALRDSGAMVHEYTAFEGITRVENGFEVTTSRGKIRCGRVVIAAGPWSQRILKTLGVDLPIGSMPLHMNVTERVPRCIKHLVQHAGRHLSMKQVETGNVVIGGGWPAATADQYGRYQVMPTSFEGNAWVAGHVIPAVRSAHVIRTWASLTPTVKDDLPIAGAVPGQGELYVAVSPRGYTWGPVVSMLMAQLIAGEKPDLDLAPFAVTRFRA